MSDAIDRLWRASKKETDVESAAFETALDGANLTARDGDDFVPLKFASALEKLQSALILGAKLPSAR